MKYFMTSVLAYLQVDENGEDVCREAASEPWISSVVASGDRVMNMWVEDGGEYYSLHLDEKYEDGWRTVFETRFVEDLSAEQADRILEICKRR